MPTHGEISLLLLSLRVIRLTDYALIIGFRDKSEKRGNFARSDIYESNNNFLDDRLFVVHHRSSPRRRCRLRTVIFLFVYLFISFVLVR